MATAYDCKFIETSVGINHNVDELLVGLLTQIRLKLENPEKSRFVHSQLPHTHTSTIGVCVCVFRANVSSSCCYFFLSLSSTFHLFGVSFVPFTLHSVTIYFMLFHDSRAKCSSK